MQLVKIAAATLVLAGCTATTDGVAAGNGASEEQAGGQRAAQGRPFQVQPVGQFNQPWAMAFIPGTNQALITERGGRLLLWSQSGEASATVDVAGLLAVDAGGQGGLGDVVLHPNFTRNRLVYLSWVQPGEGDTRGAVVGRGRLSAPGAPPRIEGLQIIWRQEPKVTGRGHFGHRLAFSPDGHLFITNGEREKFTPAQDMNQTLGKIVRLNDDGSIPRDNPWAGQGGVAAQLWTIGHRNPLGIAFDAQGRLWSHEMGPRNGDEFNLIERGQNYGYPIVSNGNHYNGDEIPDHPTRPEFRAPLITWNGVSPAGMMIYSGRMFPQWRGSAFLGGLSGRTLIRVALNGTNAREAERWDMGARVREVEQGPDGAIYVLEDTRQGQGGRLLRLTPAR